MIKPDHNEVLEWLQTRFVIDVAKGCLLWKVPPWNRPYWIGKDAGNLREHHTGRRYCHVKFTNGKAIKRANLIFLWAHKRWPANRLDHIDGNSLNDCIGNLREATHQQNAQNHKPYRRKTALPPGVHFDRGRYRVIVQGKHIGMFATVEAASVAYMAKRKELFGEFA